LDLRGYFGQRNRSGRVRTLLRNGSGCVGGRRRWLSARRGGEKNSRCGKPDRKISREEGSSADFCHVDPDVAGNGAAGRGRA
ncbi:MAG: hypothetical protein ACREQP_13110, partial [Candidatus Binatia bacterium]